ncbi:MAG: hypothetical protein JWL77_3661 [Chthonomonadaceae bacterium]|nr:hypothetical protein [Chthonomonadaceae bacterium]
MRDTTLQLLDEQGVFGVIEFLAARPDPLIATRTFAEVVGHLYWKQKDMHRTVVMAQAGIQFGLTAAIAASHHAPDRAMEIRSVVKGLAYDLGSFTWPGWNEPGIGISAAYLTFGSEAARLNLRFAHDLNKGDLPISRAFWLVGAHCLSSGEFEVAARHFTSAETHAQTAGASEEALLNKGYGCLAAALLTPQEAGNEGPLVRILAQLSETSDGADLAAQLQTAWIVLARSCT